MPMYKGKEARKMTDNALLPAKTAQELALVPGGPLPGLVRSAGRAARTAWDDFFEGRIANEHTRKAYERAVRNFLAWAHSQGRDLSHITAGDVGKYLRNLPGGPEKKKQHLAGLRRFFNLLVERHICILNPAAVAETEKLSVVEGRTPEITRKQARALLDGIDCSHVIGLRDRAIIGILMYTAARAGAVAKLDVEHYYDAGEQWMLRFRDKGGKSREIPVSHDLKTFLDEYLEGSGLLHERRRRDPKTGHFRPRPLFRTALKKKRQLTTTAFSGRDITRMLKRRLEDAGLPPTLCPHSFRVAVATDLLDQQVPLEDVQHLLGHADARTTKLYDRSKRKVTRNIVERIRLGR
jgi:site-specific recombinase XerD